MRRALAGLAFLSACGSMPPAATPAEEGVGDLEDVCSILPPECIESYDFIDHDGCPEIVPLEILFAPGSASLDELAERLLGQVAHDARRFVPGAAIRLVASSPELAVDRIAAIRASLVARHVPAERIRDGGEAPPRLDDAPRGPDVVVVTADGCPR